MEMKQLSEVHPQLFKGKGGANGDKKSSEVKYKITWNENINPTQEVIPHTNIPKSFTMKGQKVNGKEVWVHGNATKHMGEFVNSSRNLL